VCLQKFENGEAILEHQHTHERRSISAGALLQAIIDGKISIVGSDTPDAPILDVALRNAQARGATIAAIRHAAALLTWITALRQRGVVDIRKKPWIRAEINALAKGELAHLPKFAISTLYEAELKLRKSEGDAGVLVPDYARRGGRGKARIHLKAQQFMREELDKRLQEQYSRPLRTIELVHSVNNRIVSHNIAAETPIDPVSESTVRRFVDNEVPAFVRLSLRVGEKKAQKIHRSNSATRDIAIYPLEVAEYDDIDTAVFVIDGRNGLPCGRAWLTNGVDQNTWSVLGYDLGFSPRSYTSAIGAICDSLLPKADCLPGEMGHGVQGVMLVDNASYNAGKAMKHRREAESLLFARARPYGSTEKTVIEYYNHKVKSDFCPRLPGWRGDKGNRDAVKQGMDSAILTLEEFSRLYRHWVTKVYPNTPGDDGCTSKQRWLRFYKRHSPAARHTPAQLELLRMRPDMLKFRASGGLQRLGLRYDCAELDKLRRRLGAKSSVVVYIPGSLQFLKVLDPVSHTLIHVPCTEDHHYVDNTTVAQHRMILAIQRSRKKSNPSLGDLVEARELLQQMVREASLSHKLRTRRWSVRMGEPQDLPHDADAPQPKLQQIEVTCTELEYQVAQLDLVEIGDLEDWS